MGFPLALARSHGMLRRMDTTDSSRPKHLRLAAATAAALAAMTLAAGCGGSKSSGTKNAAASSTTSSSAAGSGSATATSADASTPAAASATSATSEPPKPTDPGPSGPHDCSTDMLNFKIDPLREPINHVLITATNTSKLPCHLNKYPMLRTLLSQTAIVKAVEATKPAGPILLAPGATAYAGIMTSSADGSGVAGRNVLSLELQLQPGSGTGGVGRPVSVPMPTSAQYVDSTAVVTYWESDLQSASY